MKNRIVYYVATSLDGYISGLEGDVSGFAGVGNGLEQYLKDLESFETVIMGRKTYEFGYDYGIKPGALAYPHMEHHIFSTSLTFEEQDPKLHVHKLDVSTIERIRDQSPTDVYMCGGGEFAGWLLDHQLIDVLKIKLNPLILGQGVPLFGNSTSTPRVELIDTQKFDAGLQIMTYHIDYS